MASATRTEPSIFDEILELQEESRQSTCSVGAALNQLSDEDREGIIKALKEPNIKGTLIAQVLEKRGHRMSSHTLQRHRRGACGCPKALV